MVEAGSLKVDLNEGLGTITFGHPKGNSLPGELLRNIAGRIDDLSKDNQVRVIVLQSIGDKVFCGGASFDELKEALTLERAKEFFSGFLHVILAIRRASKFVIARVQGKTVGGGVGVAAAADYALATDDASIRLSELALGIGPFIIGPAVQRKVGLAAFNEMAIDADWRDARWAMAHGLYVNVYPTIDELDSALNKLTKRLSKFSPEAMVRLKKVLWEGTEHWPELLPTRVGFTSELSLTEYVRNTIATMK